MGEIKQTPAGSIKIGNYLILDGIACVVRDIQKAKTGKHGSTKCRIEAIGIINNQKKVHLCPAGDNVEVPIIEKKKAQVLSVQEDTATVMDNETYETFDLKISEEMKGQVQEGRTVDYWIILDEKIIIQAR